MAETQFKVGDHVSYDLVGPKGKVGQGAGIVTRADARGGFIISPDKPLVGNLRMENIKVVSPTTKR